jgi:hypothetical protein
VSVDDLLVGEDALDFNGLMADGVAELIFACHLIDAFVVSYRRTVDFVDDLCDLQQS